MSDKNLITNLKELQKNFLEFNFDKFYRVIDKEQSFKNIKTDIESLEKRISDAIDVAENVSTKTLQEFNRKVSAIITHIKRTIDLETIQFYQQIRTTENQISKEYDDLLSIWPEFEIALIRKQLDISSFKDISQFKDEIKDITIELEVEKNKSKEDNKVIKEIKEKLENEFNNFESRIKDTVTKGEFLVQQDIFRKQADTHKKLADNWLIGIIVAIVILIFVIIYILNNFCFETKCLSVCSLVEYNKICPDCGHQILIFELIKSILFRLFIISTSFFLLLFCVKNYNAQMHNYTINSHKQNAFGAAFSLLSKAKTDKGNDDLMLEAAQSIFSHQKTGYAGKESETQQLNMLAALLDKIKPIN